jgi:hypothetical protein
MNTSKLIENSLVLTVSALSKIQIYLNQPNIANYYGAIASELNTLEGCLSYCPENDELYRLVSNVADLLEMRFFRDGKFEWVEGFDAIFTPIMNLLNAAMRPERALLYFKEANFYDGNNHSAYRRTFAEAMIGSGQYAVRADCGVRFYDAQELSESICTKVYDDVMGEVNGRLDGLEVETTVSINALYLLSMNAEYFIRFGVAQAISLVDQKRAGNIVIVFFVFDADENCRKIIDIFNAYAGERGVRVDFCEMPLTRFESILDRNTYLASIRYCMVERLMQKFDCKVIVSDADQIFYEGVDSIVDSRNASNSDVSLFDHSFIQPYISLYKKYGASYVEFYPNMRTKKYAKLLGRFIACNLAERACWTLDQLALLYCSKIMSSLRINRIENSKIDDYEGSVIWTVTGSGKFTDKAFERKINKLLSKIESY